MLNNKKYESEDDSEITDEHKFDSLTHIHEIAYAVGHFMNDLFATGWINYVLIYLSNINPISSEGSSGYAG